MSDDSSSSRIAGESTFDEQLKVAALEGMDYILKWVTDLKTVDAFLHGLPKAARSASTALPFLVTGILGRMPKPAFISPKYTQHGFDVMVDMTRKLVHIIKTKGEENVTKEDLTTAFDDARIAMQETDIILVENLYHHKDCPDVRHFDEKQRKPAKLKQVIDLPQYFPSPCCHEHMRERLKAASAPPPAAKPAKKRKSVLEYVFESGDVELQTRFFAWLNTLSSGEKDSAMARLRAMDSVEELKMLMAMPAELRIQGIALLEEQTKAEAFFSDAWKDFKKFDASLAADIRRRKKAIKKRDGLVARGINPKRRPWWHCFFPI